MSEAGKKEDKISPKVSEKATRRRFTVAYEKQILADADQCAETGEIRECMRSEPNTTDGDLKIAQNKGVTQTNESRPLSPSKKCAHNSVGKKSVRGKALQNFQQLGQHP